MPEEREKSKEHVLKTEEARSAPALYELGKLIKIGTIGLASECR